MGYKTGKKGYTKEKYCFGNENKQNGSMEGRAKIREVG